MPGSYEVHVVGLRQALGDMEDLPDRVSRSALQAVNRTAERARTRAAEKIGREVNFPRNYLSPAGGRLTVAKKAQKGDLEARVRARSRATSLARFVASGTVNRTGVRVEVAPGRSKYMRRAFLVTLRAGSSTETKSNLGLAIRLRPGETLQNKVKAVRMERNFYLLYGPSVQQAFVSESGSGIAQEISPETLDFLEAEFGRLMELRR